MFSAWWCGQYAAGRAENATTNLQWEQQRWLMLGKRATGQRLTMVSKRGRRPSGKSVEDHTTVEAEKCGRQMTQQARGTEDTTTNLRQERRRGNDVGEGCSDGDSGGKGKGVVVAALAAAAAAVTGGRPPSCRRRWRQWQRCHRCPRHRPPLQLTMIVIAAVNEEEQPLAFGGCHCRLWQWRWKTPMAAIAVIVNGGSKGWGRHGQAQMKVPVQGQDQQGGEGENKGGALLTAVAVRRKGQMLAIPDTQILCWDWFCVSMTVRCRPKVPTFRCRLGMLPTCPQHSQPRLHGAMRHEMWAPLACPWREMTKPLEARQCPLFCGAVGGGCGLWEEYCYVSSTLAKRQKQSGTQNCLSPYNGILCPLRQYQVLQVLVVCVPHRTKTSPKPMTLAAAGAIQYK